ncbi:MAG: hypothetical protein JHD00_05175 [Akkermansiaceae bacterium]|jgi:hypothetical protein|nr:hypothetical protein [Akkermansiaceae bacterium]
MVKTQIQFPDGLYKRLKRLAAEQEWSLAETLRRGAELLLATRPLAELPSTQAWAMEPPANTQLRCDPFADEDWRLAANLGSTPAELAGI